MFGIGQNDDGQLGIPSKHHESTTRFKKIGESNFVLVKSGSFTHLPSMLMFKFIHGAYRTL
jgi:hypothetical protein